MCRYCEQTSCISTAEYDSRGISDNTIDSIEARVRLDIIPEDNLYQIDSEVVAFVGNSVFGEWSTANILDINYCPMCGRKLRDNIQE